MIRRLQADDEVAYSALRLRGLELHPEAGSTRHGLEQGGIKVSGQRFDQAYLRLNV